MTPLQSQVLEILFGAEVIRGNYYFTGGTALAEFYLQHRHSDDLDVFTKVARNIRSDFGEAMRAFDSQKLEISVEQESDEFVQFLVQASGETEEGLKVEFGRDAGAQISPAKTVGNVVIDSFEDIAVNKVLAIYGRTEVKDYVDLFFILRESQLTMDYLVGRAKEKRAAFDREDTVLEFAANLLKVKDLQLHNIRIIKPLDIEAYRSHLTSKAEALLRSLRPRRLT